MRRHLTLLAALAALAFVPACRPADAATYGKQTGASSGGGSTYTPGTGIGIDGGVIANTAPSPGSLAMIETSKIDMTAAGDTVIVPANPGKYWVTVTAIIYQTDTAGAFSVGTTAQGGNNASVNNVFASQSIGSSANFNAGTPARAGSLVALNPAGMTDLATPITFRIATGATGTGGFVWKVRFIIVGFYVTP